MKNEYFEHLKEVNRTFYDQAKVADQKAAYMFTFMLALLIWSTEVRRVFSPERYLGAPLGVQVVSAIVAAALVVCVMAVILIIMPRKVGKGSSLFWGAWEEAAPRLAAVADGDTEALIEEYRTNIGHLAAICRAKYRAAGIAYRSLAVAVLGQVTLLALP